MDGGDRVERKSVCAHPDFESARGWLPWCVRRLLGRVGLVRGARSSRMGSFVVLLFASRTHQFIISALHGLRPFRIRDGVSDRVPFSACFYRAPFLRVEFFT